MTNIAIEHIPFSSLIYLFKMGGFSSSLCKRLPEGTGKSQWENTIGYYDCIFQRDIFRQCDCPKMEVSQFENGNVTDYICLQP